MKITVSPFAATNPYVPCGQRGPSGVFTCNASAGHAGLHSAYGTDTWVPVAVWGGFGPDPDLEVVGSVSADEEYRRGFHAGIDSLEATGADLLADAIDELRDAEPELFEDA